VLPLDQPAGRRAVEPESITTIALWRHRRTADQPAAETARCSRLWDHCCGRWAGRLGRRSLTPL